MNQHYIFFGVMLVAIVAVLFLVPETEEKGEGEVAKMVCKNCGSVKRPKSMQKGSFILLFFLFCFFIIPGLFYGLWMMFNTYKACKACGSTELVPANSPEGRRLMDMQGQISA